MTRYMQPVYPPCFNLLRHLHSSCAAYAPTPRTLLQLQSVLQRYNTAESSGAEALAGPAAAGDALRPALLWMDMRSADQAAQVASCGDEALQVRAC